MDDILLNRRLVLQDSVEVADGAGGFSTTWQSLGQVWAHIDARSGRMRKGASAAVSEVRFRIVVRAAPVGSSMRPKADQRFLEAAQAYVIDAVAPYDMAGRYLECWARHEVVA